LPTHHLREDAIIMTMPIEELTLSPNITLTTEDYGKLTKLAHAGINVASTVADDLLYELDRARVLPAAELPPDVVRMGSTARYRTFDGDEREITLVYPAEADIGLDRISVMTPIGAALVGLSRGQSITWLTRDGRKQVLTLLDVRQPAG
jgi:regulator of nucleoside diphosphate kinase